MLKQTVLFAENLDLSSQPAQLLSANLAKAYHADLHVVCVEDLNSFRRLQPLSAMKNWHSQHQSQLDELMKQYWKGCEGHLKTGHAAQEILKFSQGKFEPELIVMTSEPTSVSEEVLRSSSKPVLIVGPKVSQEVSAQFLKNKKAVLVATDLRKTSSAAELYALSFASRLGVELILFHSLYDELQLKQEDHFINDSAPKSFDKDSDEIYREAEKQLKAKVALMGKKSIRANYRIVKKDLKESLKEEFENPYEVIVMGSRSRNALLRSYLGESTREAILHAPVPVLVVHS